MLESSPNPPDENGRARRRRRIFEVAEGLFFEYGYLGTSMDMIAAGARVAKQTLYSYFTDKEGLFLEIVTAWVSAVSDPVATEVLALARSENLEEDLRALARLLLQRVLEPPLPDLRRLVIGESKRFPELGRTFYERGPGQTIGALGTAFERLAEQGRLRIDDPAMAANHFTWLIMSAPINQTMLVIEELRDPLDHARLADAGVTAFLAAYGPR